MSKLLAILGGAWMLAGSVPAVEAKAVSLRTCSAEELKTPGYRPDESVAAHRHFDLPRIAYPFGTRRDGRWGFTLRMRVGADGRPQCIAAESMEAADTAQRRRIIKRAASWRYDPLLRDGTAVAVMAYERIDEAEAPARHIAMPRGELKDVVISLSRSECFGTCPAYKVTLRGDGRAVYEGEAFVAVNGRHVYQIAPEAVAGLIDAARKADLWSLRDDYQSRVSDSPSYRVSITVGGKTKVIEDYVGSWVGMSRAVTQYEALIDQAGQTDTWINVKSQTLDRLKAEGFDFRTQAGAEMLARGVNSYVAPDEAALVGLMDAGAPLRGGHYVGDGPEPGPEIDLLPTALIYGRRTVVDALLARGALPTDGAPDQARVDAAFQAAIRFGRMAEVRLLWAYHPGLTFQDRKEGRDGSDPQAKTVPVTLLLQPDYGSQPWEGFEIAKFLLDQGCDVKASGVDGRTLLHIAAANESVAFVKYLIARGADVRARDETGDAPLDKTHDADVVIALIEAGA